MPIHIILWGVIIFLLFYVFILLLWNRRILNDQNTLRGLQKSIQSSRQQISEQAATIHKNIDIIAEQEIKIKNAALHAEDKLEIEYLKRRKEFEQQLASDLEKLQQGSPLESYKKELATLQSQIAETRRTLEAHQSSLKAQAEKEDFKREHSICLNTADKGDIQLIKEFAPRLARQEAFLKLIWTEFYQKPLQALCKELKADKTTGIYKITGPDEKIYIGQAIDIGTRWKEHVKAGLGIGASMTNKFYRAMREAGPENFTFEILEILSSQELNERERHWIDFYNATTYGYNTKIGG